MPSLLAVWEPPERSPDWDEARLRYRPTGHRPTGPSTGSGCVAFAAAYCASGSDRADAVIRGAG
jgi:hypothetical protein